MFDFFVWKGGFVLCYGVLLFFGWVFVLGLWKVGVLLWCLVVVVFV